MVGVEVRVNDVENPQFGILRRAEIGRDLAHRIDHGGRGLSAAAKEVGDRHWISVQELPQDNGRLRVFSSSLPRRLSQQRNDINILYD